MNLETLLAELPDYAKDLRLNLSSVLRQTELTEQQAWGTAVATAAASRNAELSAAILEEAAAHLSPEALRAAKAAAAIMGMNNIYYRFLHVVDNEKYRTIPARLRMQVIRSHGGDPVDFELWCLAVSAINNCQACLGSHERVLREKGVSEETILASVRIAAVIHGLAAALDLERVPNPAIAV
ncbi:MAG: carboxymuconolactone decarboxylase family protein [Rhodospirillales bacterium]